ncbi:MAG: BlaI/MecI/CopY family transcriptional regulator [Bacteroidaceae bacterium]|nr:BlaI/MecI/CopY family transcriptional regulator [Bacteroidaceae bacterium]
MKTNNRRESILSKTEYDIMSIIWDFNHSVSAREIYDQLPEPKPAYTTLATEMRTLFEKGFVDHFKKDGEGKTHHYMARVGRAEYVRKAMHDVKRTFFGGSLRSMLSYFIREEEISEEELISFLHELEEAPSDSPFGGGDNHQTNKKRA